MTEREFDFSSLPLPTDRQIDYAESLVQKLQESGHLRARRYATEVAQCQDRVQMSALIDEMKRILHGSA